MDAVLIKKLAYAYGRDHVLTDITLSIKKGEIFGFLGPNGGGKTTLFRILTTLFKPSEGSVHIFNNDSVGAADQVRKKIGVVFQNPSLDKKLTLHENMIHQGHLYGLKGSLLEDRIQVLLRKVKLDDRAHDQVEILSGGMQRRGEIAKGLLHNPDLLILDEPSTGLDPGARRDMWDYLLQLKKEGCTILVTTHLTEEGEKCDRLAIIDHGKIIALGSPNELKKEIGGDVVTLSSTNPQALLKNIEEKFKCTPTHLDGTVRIEIDEGHQFIPKIVEAFPGLVTSATVGKPTLEDVFIRKTGRLLWHEQEAMR